MKKKEKIIISISIILSIIFIFLVYYSIQKNYINFILILLPSFIVFLSILVDINYRDKSITWKDWTKKEKIIYYTIVILIIIMYSLIFLFNYEEKVYILGYTLDYDEFRHMYTSLILMTSSLFQTIYISFILPHNRKKRK